MVYFDNAATTYPKPQSVINAINEALSEFGANPGRSGYKMAFDTAEMIYETRAMAAKFFGISDPLNVIFTQNCTFALNCAIKGLAKANSHFIISSLEHNAVVRPLETLRKNGIADYSVAKAEIEDEETVNNFKNLINDKTVAIVCTGASNVFGKILPIKKLGELAHKNGIKLIVDCAQIAGIEKIDCKDLNADFLCVAAHKGLYAPMSIGMLLLNTNEMINTLVEGGTGSLSAVLTQPNNYPDRFESGTLSTPLIAGLNAGIRFVEKVGLENIKTHEESIIKSIYSEFINYDKIKLYTDLNSHTESFVPMLSFNIKNMNSEEAGALLAKKGIAVRSGLHCASLAHKAYGTEDVGTIRIAPSFFTNYEDVNLLLKSVFEIAKGQ